MENGNNKIRKKIFCIFTLVLVLSVEITLGKTEYKTKTKNDKTTKYPQSAEDVSKRSPRSVYEGKNSGNPLSPHYQIDDTNRGNKNDMSDSNTPFWGTRGRRESEPVENFSDEYPDFKTTNEYFKHICKNCNNRQKLLELADLGYFKERRDEPDTPFWGNRGRRSSEEIHDDFQPMVAVLDKNKEDDPFWGARGRREDDEPFWGNRGRRDNIIIRKFNLDNDDTPFWSARGRREEIGPFWGNRGRRDDIPPFWGNRGRRQESQSFWDSHGRKISLDPDYAMLEKQQFQLKNYIRKAINTVEDEIQTLSRLRRSNDVGKSFLLNSKGRNSFMTKLFQNSRNRFQVNPLIYHTFGRSLRMKPAESKTLLDDRIYAEEPKYILVERSSRSSGEEDPYYISRGKKKINLDLVNAARGRRGAIEELVKSVRNDPYYIARGKKDMRNESNDTDLMVKEELNRAKQLICASIDLLMSKTGYNKTKRDIPDTERDRRTILKKLAAQLQIDPYFVSRGKRGDSSSYNENENIYDFINEMSAKCH